MRGVVLLCVVFLGCSATEIPNIEEEYRNRSKCIKYSMGLQTHPKHGDDWDIDPPYSIRPLERFSITCKEQTIK